MSEYAIHPAAEKMPRMDDQQLGSLIESIRARGLIEPIVLCDGMILDGRHRYIACLRADREPRFVQFSGGNPWQYVWDRNGERRHFKSDEQKFLVFKTLTAFADEWEAERKAIADAANAARSEAAKEQIAAQPRDESGRVAPGGATVSGTTRKPRKPKRAADAVAEKLAINRGAVQRAEQLAKHRPDLAEKVATGELKATAAVRQMATDTKRAELERPVEIEVDGLHRGDFRELAQLIPDASVELIFTDPPYDDRSIPLFEDAARIAARILKPGGSMFCYCGQMQLPHILQSMSQHLRYWWICQHFHDGGPLSRMEHKGIIVHGKPVVWFVKDNRGDTQTFVDDYVSVQREKTHHEWQQAEAIAAYYVEKLCPPGGMVVDFFAGGGTTLVAAKKLGRRYIGYEISAKHFESAAARLAGTSAS